MCPKSLRSSLVLLLIAAFVLAAVPVGYANTGIQQQAAGQRPRRGKNGQPVPAGSTGTAATSEQKETEPAETDSDQPHGTTATPSQPERQPQATTANQSRRTPPPFDRPAATSGGQSSESSNRGAGRATGANNSPRYDPQPPPRVDRSGDDTSTSDIDRDAESNRRGAPPVLHRPSESRSQSDRPVRNSGSDRSPQPDSRGGDEGAPAGDDEVIRLESTLVNIPLLVSDRAGRYIPRLSERDFLLYEDGVQQEIASFGSEEVPFNVALLLDMSPSVMGNTQDIQDAAIAFVRQLRPQDRVMIVSFDRSVDFLTDFTNNRRLLEDAIRGTSTGSGTSVYDAVYQTVERRLRNIDGRKALILFSDGEDTTSHTRYDDAVNIVTESDVLVYGLRYPGSETRVQIDPGGGRWPQTPFPLPFPWPFPRRRRGPFTGTNLMPQMSVAAAAAPQRRRGNNGDFMADITAAGGGPVYDAEKISDLSRLAYQIAEELRHVYVLSYYPSNPLSNGGYRSIRIQVKGRDDIAVRHRRGYNAHDVRSTRTTE